MDRQEARRAAAFDSRLGSASNLTAMLPAWATAPVPSADTDNQADHVVCLPGEVPLGWAI